MGTYNSTYVGVYIQIPHYKKEHRRDVLRHPKTNKVMKTKFCPMSGEAGIPDVIVENVWIEPARSIDEPWVKEQGFREDEFFAPVYTRSERETVLLSNGKYQLKTNGEFFNLDISDVDPKKLIEEFKIEYKLYLDYYYDFHFDDLKVCFGVVNYAH
jgi:hypothetical protein